MKTLIVCESVHHGNTGKVAEAMARALGAELKRPAEVDPGLLGGYDLIGFGSGIYNGNLHQGLLKLARDMPAAEKAAFVFSTSGAPWSMSKKHKLLKETLASKGFRVLGDFNCKGWNTHGPEAWLGGLNKGKPDATDLENARRFAADMAAMAEKAGR
jgi:flavodoxin